MYRLMIVDDEEKIREGIRERYPFDSWGFEIVASLSNGAEALAYIERNRVDLMLCDIRMPVMGGLQLLQQISERGLPVMTIFLSGYGEFEYARQAIQYGARGYILKPIKGEELAAALIGAREDLDTRHGKTAAQQPAGYYDQIVGAVKEYITGHLQDATLEAAASLVGLSPNYLSKLFKQKTGENFSEYLLAARMDRAVELLADISLKTYDVAYQIGYDNPKNFSRAFKSYFGKTPREFRQGGEETGDAPAE